MWHEEKQGLGAVRVAHAWENANLELVSLFFVGPGYYGLQFGALGPTKGGPRIKIKRALGPTKIK